MSRKALAWISVVIGLLLVVTNAWWFLKSLDSGTAAAYQQQQLATYDSALREATRLLAVSRPGLSKSELLAEAEEISESDAFEKDGCVWVGSLGFKFDDRGKLIHVALGWSFGEDDPCYP